MSKVSLSWGCSLLTAARAERKIRFQSCRPKQAQRSHAGRVLFSPRAVEQAGKSSLAGQMCSWSEIHFAAWARTEPLPPLGQSGLGTAALGAMAQHVQHDQAVVTTHLACSAGAATLRFVPFTHLLLKKYKTVFVKLLFFFSFFPSPLFLPAFSGSREKPAFLTAALASSLGFLCPQSISQWFQPPF